MKTFVFIWHQITILKVLVAILIFFTIPHISQYNILVKPVQTIEKESQITTSTYSLLNITINQSKRVLMTKYLLKFKKEISLLFFTILIGISSVFLYIKKRRKIKDINIIQNEIRAKENSLSAKLIIQEKKIKELTQYNYQLYTAMENSTLKNLEELQQDTDQILKDLNLDNILVKTPERQKTTNYNGLLYLLKQRHPKLSQTDLKHCLFVHMQLSLKKTSELLHVTIATVKSGRHRAKRKIDLPKNIKFKEYLNIINKEYNAIKLDTTD
ncbi:helix-turn-helix transcriptional regulator [Aquimarina aggregata]|uniref:helix-turn-helix transcriptional regulator n=1 Tax=Aquimarina aggregata TaxID=1642818 RepID=UPI002492ECD0|nr:hypothetical protein [Aquimarina aggregata]